MKIFPTLWTVILVFSISSTAQGQQENKNYTLGDTILAKQYLEEATSAIKERKFGIALEKVGQSREIFAALKGDESKGVAIAWHLEGAVRFYSGAFQSASEAWEHALVIRLKVFGDDHPEVGASYNNLGAAYEKQGAYEKAIQCHENALKARISSLGEEHKDVAVSYNNLAGAYYVKADYDEAAKYYKKALDINTRIQGTENPAAASFYGNLGSVYEKKGDLTEAIYFHEKALKIKIKALGPEDPSVAISYNNLGNVYYALVANEKAIDCHKKALNIRLKTLENEHPSIAITYHNLGNAYFAKGDYGKAVEYRYMALQIRLKKLGPDHPQIANTYNALADIYSSRKHYDQSIEFNEKALDIRLRAFTPDHPLVAQSYNDLGSVYRLIGDNNLAVEYHQKALQIRLDKLGNQHPDVAYSYGNLANAYFGARNYDQAIINYRSSLEILTSTLGPDHPDLAKSYKHLADIAAIKKQYQKAEDLYEDALQILNVTKTESHTSPNHYTPFALIALRDKAAFLRNWYKDQNNLDRLKESRRTYQIAIDILIAQFQAFSFGALTNLSEKAIEIYEGTLLTNQLLCHQTGDEEYLHESFEFGERSKSFLLYHALQEASALKFAGIPEALLNEEYDLRLKTTYLEKKRQEYLYQGLKETDDLVLETTTKLFDLNQRYDSLKNHFESDYRKYYDLKYDLNTVVVEEVQNQLLGSEQTLLEYFVGDSSIYIFTINAKDYQVLQVPRDLALDSLIQQFRMALYGPYVSESNVGAKFRNHTKSAILYADAAHELYQKLIKPIEDQLQQKVLIIPDGILGYVPFQALIKKKSKNEHRFNEHRYFGMEHQISYSYSATLLREMTEKQHAVIPEKSVLAVAPYYDGTLYRLDSIYKKDLESYALPLSELTGREELEPLVASGEEAYTVSKIWEGDYLLREDASEGNFAEMAHQYQQLHLATHGKADDKVGEYAYLAFTEIEDNEENELLYVKDIYNLDLNADLVVLSACETGTGELKRGEGIISLARAFAYAGAKSIVTTLWNVNDAKSKDLMIDFHLNLKNGDSKDTALWKAQQKYFLASTGMEASPYFWAPFIVIGDLRPIEKL